MMKIGTSLHCLLHAQRLVAKGMKTYVLGGELKHSTDAIIGLVAAKNLHNYNFSKCFIGTNGIAIRQGFTTPDTDEAYLKAAAMERSFVSYVLADASKFDKVSTVSFAPLDQAAIITDRLPDPEYGERTVVKEVALL
jgi:DeoR family transcriptional regulator, fructose operon transcriptional repressor